MFEELPFADPVAGAAPGDLGWDDLGDLGEDPAGDDWGPVSLTAADAPAPSGWAGFLIAHGTGLEDPGVLDALLAASGTADHADLNGSAGRGSAGVAGAVRVAGVQSRLGREAGGVLAAAVADACDPGAGLVADLSSDAVVGLVAAGQRLAGFAVGAQLVGAAELVRRYEATGLMGEGEAVAELALETGLSEYALGQRAYAARVLPVRFPAVYAALVSGVLEWAKAWAVLDKAVNLPLDHDGEYEAAALGYALTHNLPQLRGYLIALVLRLDPEGAVERAKAAHARRGVRVTPGEDSTATLAVTAAATAIASARAALHLLTDAVRADQHGTPASLSNAGDSKEASGRDGRDASATTADVLLDLIENAAAALSDTASEAEDYQPDRTGDTGDTDRRDDGDGRDDGDVRESGRRAERDLTATATSPATGPPDRPRGRGQARKPPSRGYRRQRRRRTQVNVTMALSTVLGLNEDPAQLEGYGPIPAVMAREVVASGTWRCVVTDDRPGQVHGTLLGMGRGTYTPAYTASDRAWEFIVDRDQMCAFPGCRRQAARCDLDHRVPWPVGDTCDCNLEPLCRRHHRLKHETRFRVTRHDTDTWTWTTPNAHTFDREPTVLPHAPLRTTPPTAQATPPTRPPDDDPPPF